MIEVHIDFFLKEVIGLIKLLALLNSRVSYYII